MTRLTTEVRSHYHKNTLTTVLALTPPSPKMISEAHVVYGEAVAQNVSCCLGCACVQELNNWDARSRQKSVQQFFENLISKKER